MTAPRLSTVRLPLHEIGRRGFAYAERSSPASDRAGGPADRARHARLDRADRSVGAAAATSTGARAGAA